MAAHDEAVRLDPNVATSVEYTLAHLALSSRQRSDLAARHPRSPDAHFVLAALGDDDTTRKALSALSASDVPPAFRRSVDAVIAAFTKSAAEATIFIEQAMAAHTDPEALFLFGAMMLRIGNVERGLEISAVAVHAGYSPALTLTQNHTYDSVRGHTLFTSMQEEAQRGMRAAQQMFEAAGGPEMLGMPAATRLSR